MKKYVNEYDFIKAFEDMGRANFSTEGLQALFYHIECFEECTGTDTELDVIALCCEYTEYNNFKEFTADYSNIESIKELEDYTHVIKIDDEKFIIQNF